MDGPDLRGAGIGTGEHQAIQAPLGNGVANPASGTHMHKSADASQREGEPGCKAAPSDILRAHRGGGAQVILRAS